MDLERLITPEEWHAAGGPAPAKQAKMRMRGEGPRFLKIGHNIKLRPSDIARYYEAQERTSTRDTGRAA